MKRIILKPGEEGRIKLGHPWVYDNEAGKILDGGLPGELEPGETAEVESSRKEYLGRAFVNPRSKILARIYSPSKEGADKGFFKRRIRQALERRAHSGFYPGRDSLRLVFAEADFLPGLMADLFAGWPLEEASACPDLEFGALAARLGPPRLWIALQFLCAGMDARRELVLEALGELFPETLAGVVERSAPVRELEGLPAREGLLWGAAPAGGLLIFENGLPFGIDLEGGQKTGHFLDQRNNRALAARHAAALAAEKGALRVLDAFSYTGGFGVHVCRLGGPAVEALCVDASGAALEGARRNGALNGLGQRLQTQEADVFEFLRAAERRREKFGLIVLDPPAFAKTKSALPGALRGYREINLRALKLLDKGGVLVTCSCSQALREAQFQEIIAQAAADAERRLQLLDCPCQPPDHPVLLGYGESHYLKCSIYRVLP